MLLFFEIFKSRKLTILLKFFVKKITIFQQVSIFHKQLNILVRISCTQYQLN